MASHLVETVMINVDDFADSFLTCGTCFTGYGADERAAKLLPCSHTICRSCLDRILETQTQTETFRCPICRESIPIPTGGAAAFPPAFIVNQLLDLIATQRRDVVPKCRLHPSQELLFCETCDVVFCTECRGRSHAVGNLLACDHDSTEYLDSDDVAASADDSLSNSTLNHNVISFNVAIKRCTEIMLYKMRLCIQELNSAQEAVTAELDRLSTNKNACVESISAKFAEINALVERRQTELLDSVKRIADEKQRALTDQLALIDFEREAVTHECNSLKGILDVRSISKAISYLNEKLDTVSSLTEPRENAFLRYQDCAAINQSPNRVPTVIRRGNVSNFIENHLSGLTVDSSSTSTLPTEQSHALDSGTDLIDIARCLAKLGRILVSTTYPPLCTVRLPPQLVAHLSAKAVLQSVDYHGRPQSSGGTDPVEVSFTDPEGRLAPTQLVDMGDGTYELLLRPTIHGRHQLSVQILNRPVRGSPFQLNVRRAQQRVWSVNEGADAHGLIQPFAVAYGPMPDSESEMVSGVSSANYIYLLDTGNSRLLVVHPDTGTLHTTLVGAALAGQAATGITWSPDGLWIVNWRSKRVYLLDPRTDQVGRSIHSSHFVEPTSVCRCPLTGRLYVADNGASCVFSCNPITGHVESFLGAHTHGLTKSTDESSPSSAPGSSDTSELVDSLPSTFPEPQSFRRITGLCATDTGLLVVAMGSTIRVFSPTGVLLNCLLPPLVQDDCSGHIGNKINSRSLVTSTYLDDNISRGSTMRASRLSRISFSGVPMNLDRCSLSSMRPLQSTNTISLRGQFGGVCVTHSSALGHDDALLGNSDICLLATYSDRRRSGVVVWTQSCWLTNTQSHIQRHSTSSSSSSSQNLFVQCTEPRNNLPAPYLIEADPGLRRLAGIHAIPKTQHMVVVDQGAQSLCSLLYI